MEKKPFDYKKFNQMRKTPLYWGRLDHKNKTHRYIMSLMYQLSWVYEHKDLGREVPDVKRLGEWLQSEKSPVKKPIGKMAKEELSKVISALENMITKKYPDNGQGTV